LACIQVTRSRRLLGSRTPWTYRQTAESSKKWKPSRSWARILHANTSSPLTREVWNPLPKAGMIGNHERLRVNESGPRQGFSASLGFACSRVHGPVFDYRGIVLAVLILVWSLDIAARALAPELICEFRMHATHSVLLTKGWDFSFGSPANSRLFSLHNESSSRGFYRD
jgi:hypothetical protein